MVEPTDHRLGDDLGPLDRLKSLRQAELTMEDVLALNEALEKAATPGAKQEAEAQLVAAMRDHAEQYCQKRLAMPQEVKTLLAPDQLQALLLLGNGVLTGPGY